MVTTPELDSFAAALHTLPGVHALWVGGSAATGDYRPGVSDLDLVALVDGPPPDAVRDLHRDVPAAVRLGCVYVDLASIGETARRHPTYTHGVWIERPLSGLARAELLQSGYAVFGPGPTDALAPMTADDVRAAVRAELDGYWRGSLGRPWEWLDIEMQDLALTTAARAVHALDTGELITKSTAIDDLAGLGVPAWLVDRTATRRDGVLLAYGHLRGAVAAWLLMSRTRRSGSIRQK